MDFDTLDKQMRRFEQSLDRTMLEGIHVVARLDGHGFTRLTKKEWDLEKPFDIRFRDAMIETTKHLMDCGFRIVYGYTQSDEISLLFHLQDDTFGRKERKLISILAAEASVAFSMRTSKSAVFDCRLVPLPTAENVVDYFRWRQEDAHTAIGRSEKKAYRPAKHKNGFHESQTAKRMKSYLKEASITIISLCGKNAEWVYSFVTSNAMATIQRPRRPSHSTEKLCIWRWSCL